MNLTTQRAFTSILLVMSLAMPSLTRAQQSLDLFGQDIAVGTEREVVIAALKGYRLQCAEPARSTDDCDSLFVQRATPPYTPHANIGFNRGRVSSVLKYWSSDYEGTDPTRFAQTLFNVVERLSRETGLTPTVTTAERRDPGVLSQSVFISAGSRSVTIEYVEGLRGADGLIIPTFVNITEKLE